MRPPRLLGALLGALPGTLPAARHVCLIALACGVWAPAHAQAGSDPAFLQPYPRQYQAVKGLSTDMVAEELRQRIEVIASRGSGVGAASNDRRVRGFETLLLSGLQASHCPSGAPTGPHPTKPMAALVEQVGRAAQAQRLRTADADLPELSAIAQRLFDSLGAARWCALRSLDEVR